MALVYPLKNYEPGEYEGPVDTSADQLVAFGFYPQNSASPDLNVGIEREAATGKLILKTASTNISLRIGGSEYAWLDTTGLLSASKLAAVNNLYSPNLDTASGVALTIGGTNATSLVLGKAGVTVNIPGVTDHGTKTFAHAAGGTGDIWLDNGTTDTPGLHFTNAANQNVGIDVASDSLRFVRNLDETGGAVLMSLARSTGALTVNGAINGTNLSGTNTGDDSAAQILVKLITVDGAGSGLDADLLDGQQGSYYAPLASPALTGVPTAPTAAADTSTTQLATTAFVLGQASSATPAAVGTAAVGASLRYARGDHVHNIVSAAITAALGYTPLKNTTDTLTGKLTVTDQLTAHATFSSYTSDGLFGATATPSWIMTPSGTGKILFGYTDAGGGQYGPRLGFVQPTASGIVAAQVSLGPELNGDFTIRGGPANTEQLRITAASGAVGVQTLVVGGSQVLYLPSNNPEVGPWNPIWSAIRQGRRLFLDEEFVSGLNSVGAYAAGVAVVITRMTAATAGIGAPNGSGYVLEIRHNGDTTPYGYGGFSQVFVSRRNATFAQVFRAKLPVGYTINLNENPQGTNNTSYWLSSNIGTGKWEEYIRISHCGYTGTFSSSGYVFVTGSPAPTSGANLVWYLASCTVYDVTDVRQGSGSGLDADMLDGHDTSYFQTALGFTAVPDTRQVIAGAGLTGGGALSADVTLNVVANADGSIVVAADSVQVGVLATDAQHGTRGGGTLHAAVSTSVNGFMLAADKTKLDGIATGAQVNDTAAQILAKLITVDGSGSLVDADLLDGQHGSYYAPLASPSFTGNVGINVTPLAWNSAYRVLTVNSGGGAGNSLFGWNGGVLLGLMAGAYIDSSYSQLLTTTGVGAARLILGDGTDNKIVLSQAAAGTAGGSVTWSHRLFIDASGKVGIGCTPSDMLHVSGAGDVALRLQSTTPTTGRTYTIASNGAGGLMVWDQTAGAGRLFIDASGNVGIGTSWPAGAAGKTLEVYGAAGQARLALKNDLTTDGATRGGQIGIATSTPDLFIENREVGSLQLSTASVAGSPQIRLTIDSSGVVNAINQFQEAGSRVWTAATLAADRSNSQGFLTTKGVSRLADLNSPPYGFSYWDSTSTSRPYGYGTLLSWAYGGTDMTAVAGNWLFELGISTDATPRLVFRHNINGNGWSSWCEAWTVQTLTNLNQLTNGPGYITSVAGALGYTPVNKAGDTMTGALSVPTVTATAAGSSLASEAWIAPTLLNSWSNYSIGAPAGYFKDACGIVHLRGLVRNGTAGNAICTLPAGYRPNYSLVFPSVSNGAFAYVDVFANGDVMMYAGSTLYVSLDGITFRAEQ